MADKEIIELSYQLAELPSTQHRAGLAGLVLMVQEIESQETLQHYQSALLELDNLDEFGVTIKFNQEGLKALFDLTFGAFSEERWGTNKDKKKNYKDNEIRQVEKKDKRGKIKTVTEYSYSVVIPYGAFLPNLDESGEDKDGVWVELWRDMYWSIIRGRDKQRISFKERCNKNDGEYTKDTKKLWIELQNPNKATKQSGTYYLSAEELTAENLSMKDIVYLRFLLNFSPFVFQVYRPRLITIQKDKDKKLKLKIELNGYVLAIPDVANLKRFCYFFPKLLKQRSNKKFGYSPQESIIDLAEESALNLFILEDRIAKDIGEQSTKKSILGVEVIHVEPGRKLKFYCIKYLEPITTQTDKYQQIKDNYWCPWFRKQRLSNVLNSRVYSNNQEGKDEEIPPWFGFDDLLSKIPCKWLEASQDYFSHDARVLFDREILNQQGVTEMSNSNTKIRQYSEIIYRVCQFYVMGKLEVKYSLKWDQVKGNPKLEKDYSEKKIKIANEAFLAVRSRTEKQTFIEYFVSTLYPVIKKEEFSQFADHLFNKTDEIRALTLLALSSQFSSTKEDNKSNKDTESTVA